MAADDCNSEPMVVVVVVATMCELASSEASVVVDTCVLKAPSDTCAMSSVSMAYSALAAVVVHNAMHVDTWHHMPIDRRHNAYYRMSFEELAALDDSCRQLTFWLEAFVMLVE